MSRVHYQVRRKDGKRSGLESQVASQLDKLGVQYTYEKDVIHYTKPQKPAKYTPDFVLPNGIIVETKGRFVTADRQKHKSIKEQHPQLDIRFVFSNPNQKIGKKSNTTYAMWCEKHGFQFAKGFVPKEWLSEAKKCPHINYTHTSERSYGSTYYFKRCDDCSEEFDSKAGNE